MAVIENIEDFKKMKLFKAKAERCIVSNSNDSYVLLIIQPFDFNNAEFSECFLEFDEDDIFGKTNEEFLSWLKEKSDEEGYELSEILEEDFSVSQDSYLLEKMFDDTTKQLISDTSKLFQNESFQVEDDELESDQAYFTSFEDAKQFLNETYPSFKID